MSNHYEIPQQDTYTTDEAVSHLIKAIALEEEALSRLINTEADKAIAFVGKNLDFPTRPSTTEIIQFNHSVVQLLDTMLMVEWLLLKKIDKLAFLQDTNFSFPSDERSTEDNYFDY